MIVADRETTLVLTGTGDVLEPERGLMGIGSGGNYALAAARALIGAKNCRAVAVLHPIDKRRRNSLAAVDQHCIGRGVPQQGRLAGAQRHGIFARHVVHDAEAFDGLGDRLHPDDRGDPRGHRVERLFERDTQRRRPPEPHLLAVLRIIRG